MWYQSQGLLRFKPFVDAVIYNTIMFKQTETMYVDKQLKPEQPKEPITMYECGQHLSNSQL